MTSRRSSFQLLSAITAALILTLSTSAGGQVVTGVVVDSVSNDRIPAAFVGVYNRETGARMSARLTDASGRFALHVPAVPAVVKVQLMGYASKTIPLRDTAGEITIVLSRDPILMQTIVAKAAGYCGKPAPEANQVVSLWEAVRAGLEVADWTSSDGQLSFLIRKYQQARSSPRYLPRNVQVDTQTVRRFEPFKTLKVTELAAEGYLRKEDDRVYTLWAPSIGVLVSDWFVDSHCFSLQRKGDLLGLSFRPKIDQRVDIKGVIWVRGGGHPQLQSLTFDFVGGDIGKAAPSASGNVEFQSLPSGHVYIVKWRLEAVTNFRSPDGKRDMTLLDQSGGEVLKAILVSRAD